MDDDLLTRIRNTVLVILKTREEVTAVAVLAAAAAWDVTPAHDQDWNEGDVWGASILLPAESYARMQDKERERVEKLIFATLEEVVRSQPHHFRWVHVVPQLVESLTESQADLVRWARETFPKELARRNVSTPPPDDEIPF
jgi:hypothetical protein